MLHKDSVGIEVRTLNNSIFRRLIAYEAERGVDEVTVMHGWIIGFMYDHSESDIFQKDIEAKFSIAKSTVTGILKLMEKKGYICRESVPWDARLKRLTLTDKGRQLHEGTIRTLDRLETDVREGIPDRDLEIFFKTVRQMYKNLTGAGAEACNKEAEGS